MERLDMKRKRKTDPSVGNWSRSQSPNKRVEPKKLKITVKDIRNAPLVEPKKSFTGDFLKRKQSAWVEMECVICRTDFMSRRTAHRVACSRKCVSKISAMANLAKKKYTEGIVYGKSVVEHLYDIMGKLEKGGNK